MICIDGCKRKPLAYIIVNFTAYIRQGLLLDLQLGMQQVLYMLLIQYSFLPLVVQFSFVILENKNNDPPR